MSAKAILSVIVLALVLNTAPLHAQANQAEAGTTNLNPLLNQYGAPFSQPLDRGLENPPPITPPPPPVTSLSPYILGATSHPDGCCTVGGNGPIGWEIYARNGIALSFGNTFAGDLNLGWTFQGGVRTLLFNAPQTAAWVVDFGISNTIQTMAGEHSYRLVDFPERIGNFDVITPEKILTGDYLNRTLFGVSLGREVWLRGSPPHRPAEGDGIPTEWNWRAGWDFGGRWGTTKFMPNEARHQTQVIGGAFFAVHTDVEIPCGACIFQSGVRMEFSYTWNDVIQSHNRADIMDILLLWNLGVRF